MPSLRKRIDSPFAPARVRGAVKSSLKRGGKSRISAPADIVSTGAVETFIYLVIDAVHKSGAKRVTRAAIKKAFSKDPQLKRIFPRIAF